jgi:excisionase family DNA binding protein
MNYEKEFLTVKDLKAYLNIGWNNAYKLANSKGFPAIKVGNCIRISKKELDIWISKQANKQCS